ncbi:MAG: class I adenylate-forming enzyme family protein, partial [Bauldia litoralis]
QIGITEEMIETFGDTIFRLSHNHQVREGDPYRLKNWDEIDRQRPNMGLSDDQIADKIGLSRHQVLFIRTILERRRFHTGHYPRLLELGGGRRFRSERFTPHLDHFKFSQDALDLRAAMRFPPALAKKYIDEGWWQGDTLSKWLDKHAAERPDAPAIRHGDRVITWAQLADQADRLSRALYTLGIRHGEVVSVQLPNIPEYLIAFLAITRIGAVMNTIHMPYRAAEIETLVNHGRSRAIVCLSEAKDWSPAGTVLGMVDKLETLDHVIALGAPVDGALSLTELIESDVEAEPQTVPVASDPFLLLFTSGTTSAPKAVPLSYHNMLSNARVGVPEHEITPDDSILSAAPFSHLFGLYSFHIAIAAGACSVMLPVFTPPDMAATIEREKPTALWTAPAHFAAIRGLGLIDKHDLSSLKMMIMSGSACPEELVRWTAAQLPDCAVTQLWGMTETQGGLYTRPSDGLELSATSAGRASPGTEIRIADPETNEAMADGEEGELQVRGPLLFPGYFKNEAANKAAFAEDGFFRSGDLAVKRSDGAVAITGRIKDVINRGGVKFNPRDIEDLLDAHPAVLQSAIVPMPDPVLGEKACAFVSLKPGADQPTLDSLCGYLLEHKIAKNKLPERLVVVDEFPMTPTKKIIKGQLEVPA